jgi:hypothetical protein
VPKRILALLALVAVLATALAATASGATSGANRRVYVERDIVNQQLAYRPHAIGLAADGTFAMLGIRWQTYGGATATAVSSAYVRGCTPDCAQGRVFRPRATLRLDKVIDCHGVPIYSRLRYVLHGSLPSDFRRRGSELLRPLGEEDGC